jgi:hypothetical protein
MHAMRTTQMTDAQVCDPQTGPEKLANANLCDQKAHYQTKTDPAKYGDTPVELRELSMRLRAHVRHGTPLDQRTQDLLHKHEPSRLNQRDYNRARAEKRAGN